MSLQKGGGIYLDGADGAAITGSTFIGNIAPWSGGAIGIKDSGPNLYGNTLVGNEALQGCGIAVEGASSHPSLRNLLIAFNNGGPAVSFGGTVVADSFFCCDIYGNDGGNWSGELVNRLGEDGNVKINPLFCDLAAGDLSLHANSNCAAPDEGCDPIGSQGVGCDATGRNIWVKWDGSGDYPTIPEGLEAAAVGDTVTVTSGRYLVNDLSVPSGIVFRSESGLPDLVILDGDEQGRVFDCADAAAGTSIRGFIVTKGTAGTGSGGAGMFNNCQLEIHDCRFQANQAGNGGGGLYLVGSDMTIERCELRGNTANHGAGVSVASSSPTFEDCLFADNEGVNFGGAVRLNASPAVFTGCTFSGNSAGSSGGALFCYDDSDPILSSCTLYGNSSPGLGGVIRASGLSVPVLDHCIIAYSVSGAAISCGDEPVILNCCNLYGNPGGDWTTCIAIQNDGIENISLDPMFCEPEVGIFTIDYESPSHGNNSPCGHVGAWPGGCAEQPSIDSIGLYADSGGSQRYLNVGINQPFLLYLVLKNATDTSGILAWECGVPVPEGIDFWWVNITNYSFNTGVAPSYIVALSPVLPWAEAIVLAEFQFTATNYEPHDFYVTAADPSSFNPPSAGYYGAGGKSLVPLTPISGSVEIPVFQLNNPLSGVKIPEIPAVYSLDNCYPNPFNPKTTIVYSLAQPNRVRLEIFDLRGRRVRVLLDEPTAAGLHQIDWLGRDDQGRTMASGVYFYRLVAGNFQQTKRMTLLK